MNSKEQRSKMKTIASNTSLWGSVKHSRAIKDHSSSTYYQT